MSELATTPAENSTELEKIDLPDLATDIYPAEGGELYVGFVSPLGTDVKPIIQRFELELQGREFDVKRIRLSELIDWADTTGTLRDDTAYHRIRTRQEAGNALRRTYGHDIIAKMACSRVAAIRRMEQGGGDVVPRRTAYFFDSIKHPEEAALFRTIYGHGFFLIAVHSEYASRLRLLRNDMTDENARELIEIDEKEDIAEGQNTREAFELADFYIKDTGDIEGQVGRFLRLLFGALYVTPTRDEYGMHLAAAGAQRSADLSRQVGSAILDDRGDVLAIGCNEVPRAGGGTYWPDNEVDVRDLALKYDPNEVEKRKRFNQLQTSLIQQGIKVSEEQLNVALNESKLKDITEFGRTVHAEMDAIMSCTRKGFDLTGGTRIASRINLTKRGSLPHERI